MEDAKSNYWKKNNSFQNMGTIKICVSCSFDSCSQPYNRWTDKDSNSLYLEEHPSENQA